MRREGKIVCEGLWCLIGIECECDGTGRVGRGYLLFLIGSLTMKVCLLCYLKEDVSRG